jgi:hypothetical protein
MLLAPIPDNEHSCLETRRGLAMFDTTAEQHFEHITRLAKRVFSVSICVVNLLDSDCQWFKSVQGVVHRQAQQSFDLYDYLLKVDKAMFVDKAAHHQVG